MKIARITLFGNPSSVHLKQWTALMDAAVPTRIWHAESSILPGALPAERGFTFGARLPRVLRYVLAGFSARRLLRRLPPTLVHGHNASGYGLMAALSGRPYVITVYGTEVYSMPKRNVLYRLMMTRILTGARGIATSSRAMRDHLLTTFPSLAGRVAQFSWGVDTSVFFPGAAARRDAGAETGVDLGGCERPVFFVNRRVTPHYRTTELVEGFLRYKRGGGPGTLVLLKGDAFADYFAAIESLVADQPAVRIVHNHIDAPTMAALLDGSDIFVSVPISDSLSAAVLEGMACGTFAVLSSIPAYDELTQAGAKPLVTGASTAAEFESLFEQVSHIPQDERHARAQASREVVIAGYSVENARLAMRDFYARNLQGN